MLHLHHGLVLGEHGVEGGGQQVAGLVHDGVEEDLPLGHQQRLVGLQRVHLVRVLQRLEDLHTGQQSQMWQDLKYEKRDSTENVV